MGRKTLSKQKQKIDAVYKTAGDKSLKAKGRAKSVNFKSFKNRERVDESNKQLKGLQEQLQQLAKKKRKPAERRPTASSKNETMEVDEKCCEKQQPQKSLKESVDDITDLQECLQI